MTDCQGPADCPPQPKTCPTAPSQYCTHGCTSQTATTIDPGLINRLINFLLDLNGQTASVRSTSTSFKKSTTENPNDTSDEPIEIINGQDPISFPSSSSSKALSQSPATSNLSVNDSAMTLDEFATGLSQEPFNSSLLGDSSDKDEHNPLNSKVLTIQL